MELRICRVSRMNKITKEEISWEIDIGKGTLDHIKEKRLICYRYVRRVPNFWIETGPRRRSEETESKKIRQALSRWRYGKKRTRRWRVRRRRFREELMERKTTASATEISIIHIYVFSESIGFIIVESY